MKKAVVGIRDRYSIDLAAGGEMSAKGNITDHEFEIEKDGNKVAEARRSGSACETAMASRSSRTRMTP